MLMNHCDYFRQEKQRPCLQLWKLSVLDTRNQQETYKRTCEYLLEEKTKKKLNPERMKNNIKKIVVKIINQTWCGNYEVTNV